MRSWWEQQSNESNNKKRPRKEHRSEGNKSKELEDSNESRGKNLSSPIGGRNEPTSSRTETEDVLSAGSRRLLEQLSDSCREHWNACHNDNDYVAATSETITIPMTCRKALSILGELLPRVEKRCYQSCCVGHPQHTPWLDLWKFYDSVLKGTFCPHAPHLFRNKPWEVLNRVFYLIQHIDHSVTLVDDLEALAQTIARLLSLLPRSWEVSILCDLTQMIQDSVSSQEIIITSEQQQQQHTQEHTSPQPQHQQSPNSQSAADGILEMALFPLTADLSNSADNTLNTKEDVWLSIDSPSSPFTIQACLLSTLYHFLVLKRNQRLAPEELDDDDDDEEWGALGEVVALPSDLFFSGMTIQQDPESVHFLIHSLQQIVLTPPMRDSDSSKTGRRPHQQQRAKVAALRISNLIMSDCSAHSSFGGFSMPHEFCLTQLAFMTVKATLMFLTSISENENEKALEDIATGLSFLLTRIFASLHLQQLSCSAPFFTSIQQFSLPILLDCVAYMYSNNTKENDQTAYLLRSKALSMAIMESLAATLGYRSGCDVSNIQVFPYPLYVAATHRPALWRNVFWIMGESNLAQWAWPIVISVIRMKEDYYRERILNITTSFWSGSDFGQHQEEILGNQNESLSTRKSMGDDRGDQSRDKDINNREKRQKTHHYVSGPTTFHFFEMFLDDFLSRTLKNAVSSISGDIKDQDDTRSCLTVAAAFSFLTYFLKTDGRNAFDAASLKSIVLRLATDLTTWVERGYQGGSSHGLHQKNNFVNVLAILSFIRKGYFDGPNQFDLKNIVNRLIFVCIKCLAVGDDPNAPKLTEELNRNGFMETISSQSGECRKLFLSIIRDRLPMCGGENDLKTIQLAFNASSDDAIVGWIAWATVCFDILAACRKDPDQLHRFVRSPPILTSTNDKEVNPISFLLHGAFSNVDHGIGKHLLGKVGPALMAGNPPAVLVAFATDEELPHLLDQSWGYSANRTQAIETSSNRFWQRVDQLLFRFCCGAESQLQIGEKTGLQEYGMPIPKLRPEEILLNKRASIRSLVSLCEACDVAGECGKNIFVGALSRVVRIWSTLYDDDHALEISGLCFGETFRLFANLDAKIVIQTRLLPFCAPSLFCGALKQTIRAGCDHEGNDDTVDRQYRMLSALLKMFVSERRADDFSSDIVLASSTSNLSYALEDCLPYILAQMILEKEYDVLRLTAGFKLFVLAQKQLIGKVDTRGHSVVPHLMAGDRLIKGQKPKRPWTKDLDRHLYLLAQAPDVVEQMLPLVLQRAGRSELLFLKIQVLKHNRSLFQMISARDQLMLKGFVKELGRSLNPERPLRALTMASMAREDANAEIPPSDTNQTGIDAAIGWVSSRFMYLLVNVVQSRWSTKETWEKTEDLRSLYFVLDFLRASDKTASQHFPQVMATVSGAIAQRDKDGPPCLGAELALLAVQCMSKFIRLVSEGNWESIGENLALIVVSLLPVLGEVDEVEIMGSALQEIKKETWTCAVSIITFLAEGKLGINLSPSFTNIAFLLQLPALEKVNVSLQKHGVIFEGVHALDMAPGEGSIGLSAPSEGGSVSGDSKTLQGIVANQMSLRRRLEAISGLLAHENASVRLVVLQHLISVLRENREAFHVLVENESRTSTNCFLTVAYGKVKNSRGTITELMENLLSRCAHEADHDQRLLLASTLGEVGAIAEYKLNDTVMPSGPEDYTGNDSHVWRLARPPWKVQPDVYGLRLVKDDLVRALRAAPSSSDQHKIGFAIQQLLGFLQGDSTRETQKKAPMTQWLSNELSEAGVLELVEPFWQSEFHEQNDGHVQKQPPFFSTSPSYLSWISNWCRHMANRSRNNSSNRWSKIFHACRTALRTVASGVAEFLLPVLVLDRLCFGNAIDEQIVVAEMVGALTLKEENKASMNGGDLQKAVSAIFTIIDTFQYWLERDIEERHSSGDSGRSNDNGEWSQDEATMRIEDVLAKVPYELQAKAAEMVGMSARSLRLFELASRQKVAESVFGILLPEQRQPRPQHTNRSSAAGFCPSDCLDLMKSILASLDDYETLISLVGAESERQLSGKIADSIREKIASQDWSGALQEHERALQLGYGESSHHQGILECLLELGQYESVLNQVRGITKDGLSYSNRLLPFAVQAAWRLGRWDTLSSILLRNEAGCVDMDGKYQVCLGKTLLAIENKEPGAVVDNLRNARNAVMEKLAIAARDSYVRSYEQIVRLRSLQEIEDFSGFLIDSKSFPPLISPVVAEDWGRRLEAASPESAVSLINVRLAISRLAKDSALEGRLFLDFGRRARKNWKHNIALNAFSRANEAFDVARSRIDITDISSLQLERAKLKHQIGESSAALRLLDQGDIEAISQLDPAQARTEVNSRVSAVVGIRVDLDEDSAVQVFVRNALKSIKWMIEGGLKGGNEILSGFRLIHRLAPKWEKGHFRFAKYVEAVMGSRVNLLQRRASPQSLSGKDGMLWDQTVMNDKACQKYLVLSVKHYTEALSLDLKHLYQALPRLLSLWFQFTSITGELLQDAQSTFSQAMVEEKSKREQLADNQRQLNEFMAKNFRAIPAQGFYSAIAQLVSRITHGNHDTGTVVRNIIRRVLAKFPEQCMWHLAWLIHAKDPIRRKIGREIFAEAEGDLDKMGNTSMCNLLVASTSLLRYLHDLARYEVKDSRKAELQVKPWQGEVPLSAFVPPVQAALSLSPSQYSSVRSSAIFARQIPRMRTFCNKIRLMASKARPKRVKAFAVNGGERCSAEESSVALETDIGEMHFLIKQEAKGDLRKDARVQDLNNVINRLMLTSSNSKQTMRSSRGLRLRTFAVTCLSEDTGILEWVPNTNSLRNLVMESYNPQAPPSSSKRRGKRMANPGDPTIKQNFEKKCQEMYFGSGDLRRAAQMFEDLCLGSHPPLLYWWFIHHFPNPHVWYEARTRFAQSAASWSAVGHVIGLGDRHAENILVDTTSGEIVHVDFDCLFDKGLNLPKPEVVPFRLTSNMIDAFGPTGADGIYAGSLRDAISTLRNNRDTLLSVLEPFLNDPVIDWKRTRAQQQQGNSRGGKEQDRQFKEAKRSIIVIDERLRGIYNLRNPNFKKIRRTDSYTAEQEDDEELTQVMPLSVEGQVHKLIAEATSSENLVQLYVGWMPWV